MGHQAGSQAARSKRISLGGDPRTTTPTAPPPPRASREKVLDCRQATWRRKRGPRGETITWRRRPQRPTTPEATGVGSAPAQVSPAPGSHRRGRGQSGARHASPYNFARGPGVPGRAHKGAELGDSHKWPGTGSATPARAHGTGSPPRAPPRGQLFPRERAGRTPPGDEWRPRDPVPPSPPPTAAARPGAPGAQPAPGGATHLHSSGNSAAWACAATGTFTSSSSSSSCGGRSRERSGRSAGTGPRWALLPAAAAAARLIAPGPGGTEGAGRGARCCPGPRTGRGRTARVEVEMQPERSRGGSGESRGPRRVRLG